MPTEAADNLRRAEAYADRFEPVEENRNSTAFGRTCALVEKFDLDAEDALPLIEKVNDEADNRILKCAVAGGADAIVTGDRALLALGSFDGIRILTLREFLEQA